MSLEPNIDQLVVKIDNQVNDILAKGGDEELLTSLYDIMPDARTIMESISERELNNAPSKGGGFKLATESRLIPVQYRLFSISKSGFSLASK